MTPVSRPDHGNRARRWVLAGAGGVVSAGVVLTGAACSPGSSRPDDATGRAGTASPQAGPSSASRTGGSGTAAAGQVYTVTGEDITPGGPEPFSVSVTLDGPTISAVEFTPQATNSESHRFQRVFAKQIAKEVVGKSLDEARTVRVSGASLTSDSFAKALAEIADEAS